MMKMETSEFVENWLCYNTPLGEGAYGEVRLLVHTKTEKKVACKIIDHHKYKNAAKAIRKEIFLHKMLEHENIIRYLGRRQEPSREYIFLEYAAGGELFQLIEPDIGMSLLDAQTYMKQLLCGVGYLHDRGIAHRDIKPENLLISDDGILKITDFGLATIFRMTGRERLLDKKCGTKPYLAPEVLQGPYKAQPADLWSCGITFVAMLTGELPWIQPVEDDENTSFVKWKKGVYFSETPWSKLSNLALSLARQILNVDPKKRATLEQILNHPWMKTTFDNKASDETDSVPVINKRWNSMQEHAVPETILSQPVVRTTRLVQNVNAISNKDLICFSQPTCNEDLMIQMTQSPITKDNFHNLVKRMTRFYVKTNTEKSLEALCAALDILCYTWSADAKGGLTVSTVDRSKNPLIFKVCLIDMVGKILLDFRLSKGCGLEFKKRFLKIKDGLSDIIVD